jgi:DNA-binding Lrp family transcriptional regulator
MPEALVNLRLDHERKLREVIKDVSEIPNVKWARLIFGPTDAVAFVETRHWIELETTVYKISSVDGVLETDTRILVPETE